MLSELFRGLFLHKLGAAYQAGELQFFGKHARLIDPQAFAAYLRPLHNTKWVVYCKRPFGGPKEVLRYLARYTHRVAISNRRLIACDEKGVTFKWKDYSLEGRERYKVMTLPIHEFIRRFLIHVLPAGFHRIRYYGLLASGKRAENIARARELLTLPILPVDAIKAANPSAEEPQKPEHSCPHCGGRMIIIERFERGERWRLHGPPPTLTAVVLPKWRELHTLALCQLGQRLADHQPLEVFRLLMRREGVVIDEQLVEEEDVIVRRRTVRPEQERAGLGINRLRHLLQDIGNGRCLAPFGFPRGCQSDFAVGRRGILDEFEHHVLLRRDRVLWCLCARKRMRVVGAHQCACDRLGAFRSHTDNRQYVRAIRANPTQSLRPNPNCLGSELIDQSQKMNTAAMQMVTYVVLHEVPKDSWGYGGLTQAHRAKQRQPL